MSKFKDLWMNKTHDIPIQEDLDGVKDEVHELDENLDNYEDATGKLKPGVHVDKDTLHVTYDRNGNIVGSHQDADVEEEELIHQEEENLGKPGPSIHTSEWDSCVQDVKAGGNADNAYAVCTAKLGESAFKSQYRHLEYVKSQIKKARKEMGVGFAGNVPESLLAAQDLLGEYQDDDEEREETEKLPDNSTYKADVASNDELSVLASKAEDADTKNEKDTLSDRIKQVQMNRQKAALKYRGSK